MTVDEKALQLYGHQMTEYAADFRKIAMHIHEKPSSITKYYHLPGISFLLSDQDSNVLERTKYLEALAYGDPGVLLASPGPSLSGLTLREFGTKEQIASFYKNIKQYKWRTFFALSEIDKGSDAGNLTAQLISKNGRFYLKGNKCFFGNAAVAETGIVFARANATPLGIRAIWLTPALLQHKCVKREGLETVALRGAQIGLMEIDMLEIPEENILGHQKHACERGLLGISKVFNRLRTGVGALAIGHAQGVLLFMENLRATSMRSHRSLFAGLQASLEAARCALHHAASQIDQNLSHQFEISAAKMCAVRIAMEVVSACFDLCTYEEAFENPWLKKSIADVYAWEFMEGTSAIQKQQMKPKLDEVNRAAFSTPT